MTVPVLATTAPTALWYLTRSTGIVALVLLTAVVVLGTVTSMGWRSERWPRFVSAALHRNLSLFSILLIAVHVVTTVTDGFAPIGYLDALVPFRSPYRPMWLGLGALAFDLLLVVALTTAIRHRIGYRTWRGIHLLAYASWPVAVLHGLGTGTDAARGLVLLITAACVAAVVVAVAWRLAIGWPARAGQRLAGGGAVALFVLGAAVFTVVGPLRAGWARRAGTPPALLASLTHSSGSTSAGASGAATAASGGGGNTPVTAATTVPSVAPSGGDLPGGFEARLNGVLTTSQPDASGRVTVDIKGRLTGGLSTPFDISLLGTPADGGVAMSSGQASVGSARGPVLALEGDRIVAELGPAGSAVRVTFVLNIDQSSGAVVGTARAGSVGSGDDAGGGG